MRQRLEELREQLGRARMDDDTEQVMRLAVEIEQETARMHEAQQRRAR
ncbi:hypothetical protein ACFWQG_13110 [Rhodococcus sp. NPDC058532]